MSSARKNVGVAHLLVWCSWTYVIFISLHSNKFDRDILLMYLDLVVVAAVLFGIVSRVTVQQDF